MDDYRVPKVPAKVTVAIPPDPPEARTVFLSSTAETHRGRETLSDLLVRKRFLPMLKEGNDIILARSQSIRWLLIEKPREAEWHFYETVPGAPKHHVQFVFPDGEMLSGAIFAVGRESEQRALDVLNASESFLHLEGSDGLYLVNLNHVTRINLLEK
ncbi:MAG: hypothetical protein P8Z49_11110 [Acidobacteriota bacterium]|jgi:hypothetical protein